MERDERLLPLPNASDLHLAQPDGPATYAPFYDDENAEGRSIREYFLVIYKRLPLILALTILATAVTAFYMYRLPSIYEAQTTMIIEPRKPKVTQKDATIINFGNDANYYNTQLRLLQNPELMRDVVIKLGLYRNPNLFNTQSKGVFSSLRSMVSGDKAAQNSESALPDLSGVEAGSNSTAVVLNPEEKARADAYAGALAGSLTVEQTPGTQLVNIKITTTDPNLAPKVADMVANVFIENDFNRETLTGRKTYEDLTKSIDELKDTLSKQELERTEYMKNAGLPLQSEGEKLNAARLQQMSSQWLEAEKQRRDIQAEYEAAVVASKRGEITSVIKNDDYIKEAQIEAIKRKADLEKRTEKIDTQIQEAETEKAALLVKYQPEYKGVKTLEEKINNLVSQREKLQSEITNKIETDARELYKTAEKKALVGLQSQLAAAQKSEAQAYNLYLQESGLANQQGQSAARLTNLSTYIETNRSLLNTYIQRQKEMELTITSDRPDNITISSPAQAATLVGPNRSRNVILAFLVSLAFGVGLAFLFDYLDDSIKSSDDIGRNLGLPTLALIPHYSVGKKGKGKSTAITVNNGSSASAALISLEDTRSAIAEAYRHLRTSLLFSSAGKPPQTILVTSSQPSEGKTTTAINTAITLAQSGADVVIIDCDLRRPRLHSHFGMENTTGLTNYLSGDRNPDNMLKPYPGLPNLKVVTSGPIPPNPAELLSSNEMKNMLQFLKGNFKHVVIDSPPAISFTDSAILATLVDGVVLVAMAGKSSIHLMRRFKQRLSTMGVRIYGVVLNGIKPNTLEYGYYGYGYTYSYYDAPDDDTTPRMEDEVTVETMKK